MTTDHELTTKIPASLDPGIADAMAGSFVTGENADGPVYHASFTTGRAAIGQMRQAALAIAAAQRDIQSAGLRDPQLTDRLRRAAQAKMTSLREAADKALAGMAESVAQIGTDIDSTLGLPATRADLSEAGRASDVRATLRDLGEQARRNAIREAIQAGDREAAAAVLSASPLASGFSHADLEDIRTQAEARFAPDAVAMRDNIAKLVGVVRTAAGAVEERFGALTAAGDSPAARASRSIAAVEGGAA